MSRNNIEITYDIRSLQLLILGNLLALDKVCREHNLRYYIIAGTLLGAVRHKGFIPWDDDLDVGMPREDYDKLIQHAKEWLTAPYEFVCGETDKKYTWAFGKLQNADTTLIERIGKAYLGGAYIDIFPFDGVPEGTTVQKWHFAKYKFYRRMLYFHCRDPYKHGKNIKAIPTLVCRSLMSAEKIHRKIRNILTKYKFEDCDLVADYDDFRKGIMDKSVLGKPTPLMFEGNEVWGLENYDAYLSQKYGDYMQIPKKGNEWQHKFHYLNLNKPYRSITNVDEFLNSLKKEIAIQQARKP